MHQVRVPGMLHGRMVRPRGQGAYPYNSNVPVSVDATSIAHIPGAKVVQVNNFLGVVAPKEYDAIQAAAQLKVVWNTNPILPGTGNLWAHYRQLDSAGKIPARYATTKGNVDAALASAAHTVSGTFAHHYQGHMPIGPSCCRRRRDGERRDDLEQHPERLQPRDRPDERALAAPGEPDPRALLRGLGLVRQRLCRVRHRRVGSDHVEGGRCSGPAADDALGRARLDALRPRDPLRHAGRRRRERQHDRVRGNRLRPGRNLALHRPRAPRQRSGLPVRDGQRPPDLGQRQRHGRRRTSRRG